MTRTEKSKSRFLAVKCTILAALISSSASIFANELVESPDNIDFAKLLNMRKTMVETQVIVTWDDGTPVVSAKVFDHRKNDLLGVTDKDGKLLLNVLNGTLLRLVEPNYGQQQSMRIVQGRKKNEAELLAATSTSAYVSVMVEGWTL